MPTHRQMICICVYIIYLFAYGSASTHVGHLKPFGSSGPFDKISEIVNGFPDPIIFFNEYAFKSRPVVFRQALAHDNYLSLWNTDEKLNEIFSNNIS